MKRYVAVGISLLPAVFVGSPIPASASEWEHLATTQANYATQLATERVRLDPTFYDLAKKFVRSCELTKIMPSDSAGLGKHDWHHLYLYTKGICRTWQKRIYEETKACESDNAPEWCIDHEKGRQRFEPMLSLYFETIRASMHSASDQLARYDMLAASMHPMNSAFMQEFPPERVAEWLHPLVLELLRTASAEDAIEIASRIRDSWVGLAEDSRQAFQRFATESSQLTSSERAALLELTSTHE